MDDHRPVVVNVTSMDEHGPVVVHVTSLTSMIVFDHGAHGRACIVLMDLSPPRDHCSLMDLLLSNGLVVPGPKLFYRKSPFFPPIGNLNLNQSPPTVSRVGFFPGGNCDSRIFPKRLEARDVVLDLDVTCTWSCESMA